MRFPFTKWEGLGNDFIVSEVDWKLILDPAELARQICHRQRGVGADGLVFLNDPFGMKIWNADGSLARMCGNALRCLAGRAHQIDLIAVDQAYKFSTDSGPRVVKVCSQADLTNWLVEVDMGKPSIKPLDRLEFAGRQIECHSVDTGNPHLVVRGDQMDSSLWLRCSEMLQTSKWAIDGGVNVEWWTQRPDGAIDIWVYERGVGPTLACGTGACAVFAVLESTGVPNGGQLYLPGGPLQMSFSSKGHVLKCGPARWICYGIWGQPVASSKMSDEEQ